MFRQFKEKKKNLLRLKLKSALKILSVLLKFILNNTSVDTEMCCPKGKCGCQYLILNTENKKDEQYGPHHKTQHRKLKR
jgi:hypothetical protein